MLKIKSNTNEFTIIFSEKIGKKIKCWKILCSSPLFLSASAPHLSSFFYFSALFFFSSFLVSAPSPSLSSASPFFSLDVLPFFQPKCWAQNVFQFSPTHFFFFSFLFYFQRTFFILVQCLLLLLLFSAPFSFPSAPAFMFNFLPTSKAKNILSRCFTFLLFE